MDLSRCLADFPLVAGLLEMGLVSSTCGSKTSKDVRELQPEMGWKGVMAESKDGSHRETYLKAETTTIS